MDKILEQLQSIEERINNIDNSISNIVTKETDLFSRLNTHRHTNIDSTEMLNYESPVTVNIVGTLAATSTNYPIFFTADRPCTVVSVREVHGTLGTNGSAVTLQVQKLTGTTALGSGSDLLATAINLKGTINTVQSPNLVSSSAVQLLAGDRLALKTTGTLTSVADVQVTVFILHK